MTDEEKEVIRILIAIRLRLERQRLDYRPDESIEENKKRCSFLETNLKDTWQCYIDDLVGVTK